MSASKVTEHVDAEGAAKRRLPASLRRAQILEVARDLFSREGIDETSMRNIAGRAGVSPAVLYRHFSDKDALLFALTEAFFDRLIAAFDAALAPAKHPVDRLAALMRAYISFGIDNRHEYRLTFMTALPRLKRGDEMQAFRARARAGDAVDLDAVPRGIICFGMLEACVAAAVKDRHTAITDAAVLTEAVWASGHGLVSLFITHDSFRFSPRSDLIEASIDVMLNGLLKR